MFKGLSIADIISLISVFLAAGYRIFKFSRIKKLASTEEGKDYVAEKGGKIILSLDLGIMLTAILFVLVKLLHFNLGITIIFQICLWSLLVSLQRRVSR